MRAADKMIGKEIAKLIAKINKLGPSHEEIMDMLRSKGFKISSTAYYSWLSEDRFPTHAQLLYGALNKIHKKHESKK